MPEDPRPDAPPPARPPAWEEAISSRLFRALSPPRPRAPLPAVPAVLAPYEEVAVARTRGAGSLAGTWFPAAGAMRGAVLLLHPWVHWGQAYFHRRGRLPALRAAGYAVLAVDLPGFGASGRPAGFYDRDVADALAGLVRLVERDGAGRPRPPLHVWGVSSGGYWCHPVLSVGGSGVAGAFFEDVAPHLFEWGWRQIPWGRPAFLFFRTAFRRAYRFLDLRRHAPALGVAAVAYAWGGDDPGIPAEDARALAAAAGGTCRIVPDAGHLGAIKVAHDEVIALALATFANAEAARAGSNPPPGRST